MRSLRVTSAATLILIGFGMFALGHTWAPLALELLPDTPPGYWLELIVPFLPMTFVGLGAWLLAGGGR
jgi:hypothetical protein